MDGVLEVELAGHGAMLLPGQRNVALEFYSHRHPQVPLSDAAPKDTGEGSDSFVVQLIRLEGTSRRSLMQLDASHSG